MNYYYHLLIKVFIKLTIKLLMCPSKPCMFMKKTNYNCHLSQVPFKFKMNIIFTFKSFNDLNT